MHMCIKVLVNSLTSHLILNIQDNLQSVLQTLRNYIKNQTEELKKSEQRCIELESKNDDLKQYTRNKICEYPESQKMLRKILMIC